MAYDPENIFAKIIRGEIPCEKIYEDDWAVAFNDINPQAPVHVLVIPKGAYETMDDFSAQGTPEEISGFFRALGAVARKLDVVEDGYRVIANTGRDSRQEVMHLHLHILAGRDLGGMLPKT